ncbi:hypothetical protein I4U23_005930 [Adineta vaga]|nr:hypothetical protein I4U23_005930 [Adineta vaga]
MAEAVDQPTNDISNLSGIEILPYMSVETFDWQTYLDLVEIEVKGTLVSIPYPTFDQDFIQTGNEIRYAHHTQAFIR